MSRLLSLASSQTVAARSALARGHRVTMDSCASHSNLLSSLSHFPSSPMASHFPSRSFGASAGSLGILREGKNKWERRTPLIPEDVSKLTQKGIEVFVQPSTNRIFKDSEFASAGATITEDLSRANTILGVKEFPKDTLIPHKSYMIFSHTIKAQSYNMPFLDECFKREIRLFDYETVRATPSNGGQRLIAFGHFAGLAGLIDCLRGIGERLLSLGYSTPFMGISSAYMYPDLDAAKAAITRCGRQIAELGLPDQMQPFTFVFTGMGNVGNGAIEMFKLLPHEWVKPEDLHNLKRDPFKVYGCVLTPEDMVKRTSSTEPFSAKHYFENPHEYEPIFHKRIAPHTSVLINCMYWDPKFPRLLSLSQMYDLEMTYKSQKERKFLMDADITCDIGGSVEALKKPTTIDQPFFMYDPITDTVADKVEGNGVLFLGVDNLPAEFPREASKYFSSKLYPFCEHLAKIDPKSKLSDLQSTLPAELFNSCIASNGSLTPSFDYISKLRAASEAARAAAAHAQSDEAHPKAGEVRCTLMLTGHLFDSGFVNQALDLFEVHGSDFKILHWDISPNRSSRNENMSKAVLEVTASSERQLEELITAVQTLAKVMPLAKAKVSKLQHSDFASSKFMARNELNTSTPPLGTQYKPRPPKKVLVLGSGYVSGPLVEYLTRTGTAEVTVASNQMSEAEKVVESHPFASAVHLDATQNTAELSNLISQHDATVSLLPATMHVPIAEMCIHHRRHLITASYVSPAMKALHDKAKAAGVTILNEIGLDPGLDHMSALHLIDSIKSAGGEVEHFESLCGGLPAPEAANNPFAYKFSWSPVGVLNATLNGAVYRRNGQMLSVKEGELMRSSFPFVLNPAYAFEQYPNRDSLSYAPQYGLENALTMYRGTIRYAGTCRLFDSISRLGFLQKSPLASSATFSEKSNWKEFLSEMLKCSPTNEGFHNAITQRLRAQSTPDSEIHRAIDALQWLGAFSPAEPLFRRGLHPSASASPLEVFCKLLEDKLCYTAGERDLVILIHKFGVFWPRTGQRESRTSSLISYGGDGPQRGAVGQVAPSTSGGGISGYSAMARTVGLPAAIGTKLILSGSVNQKGVIIPTSKEIYSPVLSQLQAEGISFRETTELLKGKK